MKKKNLTNAERIEILREARARLVRGASDYICCGILCVADREYAGWTTDEALKLFPELAKYKPADLSLKWKGSWGWFGWPIIPENRTRRIEVMDALIEELEKGEREKEKIKGLIYKLLNRYEQ
jgi:hypothetical protein